MVENYLIKNFAAKDILNLKLYFVIKTFVNLEKEFKNCFSRITISH